MKEIPEPFSTPERAADPGKDEPQPAGRSTGDRRSPRRRTITKARIIDGPGAGETLQATDLSADGAFIRSTKSIPSGSAIRLQLELPANPKPIEVGARVVRSTPAGIGVRFEEISAQDRSRLRSHTGFYETDEAMVRVQQRLGDLIPRNLLPLGEPSEIEAVLGAAIERRIPVMALQSGRGFKPFECRLGAIETREEAGSRDRVLRLEALTKPVPDDLQVLYLAFADAPLQYAFEGLLHAGGSRPTVMLPERIYLTERRSSSRTSHEEAWCELEVPYAEEGKVRLPLLDLGEGGASVRVAPEALVVAGMHLPALVLVAGGERRVVPGATVRYVSRLDEGGLRAGLSFDAGTSERDTFRRLKRHTLRAGLRTRLARAVSVLGGKVTQMIRPGEAPAGEVEVVRYRNRRGDSVAAIIDANFDTSDKDIRPDVAVVIAPAILKRKEVFSLVSRTIVDDLDRDGVTVVTLRFDATHMVGESTMDEQLVAEGRPYYNWTFSQLGDDTLASLEYLERRFRPKHRVLVSVSLSAIPARKVVLESDKAPVDLWIAPYGCPDAQDVLRNYHAGLDFFEVYRQEEGPETVLIHGRPVDGRNLYGEAMKSGLAFLEDARLDLSRIDIPVVWLLGSYDCWVTRSRVRSLLAAPGGGEREIFECPTGHVLKRGAEAIEVFKLMSESISKHLFGADRPAHEPNLNRFSRQTEAEWARVKRLELGDSKAFWREHLLGEEGAEIGYDVLLDLPDYPRFLARQAELLDPRPGDDIADVGCGTGNLLLSILETYVDTQRPASITFVDLVPEAVTRTEEKLRAHYSAGQMPPYRSVVADLELLRLAPLAEFLSGRLYGVQELADRVDGFPRATARKLAESYGRELHAILRGRPVSAVRVRELCPTLDRREVEIVLEMSRASRFLLEQTTPLDLRPGVRKARTAADLRLDHLRFREATRKVRLDLLPESFDRIGSSLVVSYLYDPLSTLREMYRLLKPGGVFVVSSLRRNFDPSKLYAEAAEILSRQVEENGPDAERKLQALRHFGNMVSRLIELEEDGRFRFFEGDHLKALVSEAGFVSANVFEAFGSPPTAVIVRAEK